MESLNFKNVDETVNKFPPITKPGIGEFTISGSEEGVSDKGNSYLDITFVNSDGQFKHRFFLTEKALGRVKHLAVKSGVPEEALNNISTIDQLKIALTGKKVRLVVDGEVRTNSNDKTATYPILDFSSFAEEISVSPSKLRDYKIINKVPNNTSTTNGFHSEPADTSRPWM